MLKKKIKSIMLLTAVLVFVVLTGCQAAAKNQAEGPAGPGLGGMKGAELVLDQLLGEDGEYHGFDGLDLENSGSDGLSDGCYVVENGRAISGSQYFQSFLDQSAAGEKASLRIVQYHTQDEEARFGEDAPWLGSLPAEVQVIDLYYQNGGYRMFTPQQTSAWLNLEREFPYLILVEDTMSSWGENHLLALSDQLDLDYSRFYYDMVYSSLPPFRTLIVGPMDKEVNYSSILGAQGWLARKQFHFDEEGNYTGFQQLPENYKPKRAEFDGCYVNINHERYLGEDRLEEFIRKASDGKQRDLYLRIVTFAESEEHPGEEQIHYEDLFYWDGMYYCFRSSDEGGGARREALKAEPYKMLRRLTTRSYSDPPQERQMYVLTASVSLTLDDILAARLSSQSAAWDALPPFQEITGIRFLTQ